MAKNFYDIYENGKKIKTGLTAAEVRRFVKLSPNASLSPYYKNGSTIDSKYKIATTGTEPVEGNGYSPATSQQNKFSAEMLKEWNRMNRKYGKRWQNG